MDWLLRLALIVLPIAAVVLVIVILCGAVKRRQD